MSELTPLQKRVQDAIAAHRDAKSDDAAKWQKRNNELKAQRLAEMQAKRERETETHRQWERDRAAERETQLKSHARLQYLAAGGNPDDFDSVWEKSLREQVVSAKVVGALQQAPKFSAQDF